MVSGNAAATGFANGPVHYQAGCDLQRIGVQTGAIRLAGARIKSEWRAPHTTVTLGWRVVVDPAGRDFSRDSPLPRKSDSVRGRHRHACSGRVPSASIEGRLTHASASDCESQDAVVHHDCWSSGASVWAAGHALSLARKGRSESPTRRACPYHARLSHRPGAGAGRCCSLGAGRRCAGCRS
jgi:hypothetical protein